MRRLVLWGVFAGLLSLPMSGIAAEKKPRACTGAADCKACKNCSGCKHCKEKKGTCGVCKPAKPAR